MTHVDVSRTNGGDVDLSIRPRVPDDDSQIVDILHAVNPDRPIVTVEEYRHALSTMPEEAGYQGLVGCRRAESPLSRSRN